MDSDRALNEEDDAEAHDYETPEIESESETSSAVARRSERVQSKPLTILS